VGIAARFPWAPGPPPRRQIKLSGRSQSSRSHLLAKLAREEAEDGERRGGTGVETPSIATLGGERDKVFCSGAEASSWLLLKTEWREDCGGESGVSQECSRRFIAHDHAKEGRGTLQLHFSLERVH